jgi:PAS domain S-box-containing protein
MNVSSLPEDEREQFRLLVECAQDYAIFVMDVEGRITSWNPGVRNILGYEEAEFVGQNSAVIYTPEDCEGGVPEQERSTARAEGRADDERWHQRKDGSHFWASGIVTALRDAAGELRGFSKILRDFTQRKLAEEALAAAYQKEHHIAESLQRSLLITPPEEHFAGLSVAAVYEAAWDEASVGGDFFDVFALEGGKAAFVVGDASGKGLAAAARTAEVKFALRAFVREYPNAGRGLCRLNGHLCDSVRLDWQGGFGFTTLCLALVDPAKGELTLSMAGSEPPCLVRADGTVEVVEAKLGGLPLGIEATEEYQDRTLRLGRGDTLLMLTDGIVEARRGRSTDFFGYERMVGLARQAATGSLRQSGHAIVAAAREFAGGALADDVCLLLARLR